MPPVTAKLAAGAGGSPAVVVIVGPTATGKSDLALWLAERFGGEIVNADSMQCYRGMNIGTAKPSPTLQGAVPHHLFDIVAPDENFTAADYSRLARATITAIHGRGRLPIVVGGTGLYVRALLSGLAESPGADNLAREEYRRLAERDGNAALHALLQKIDPLAAANIHPNNRVRIIRALEVFAQTGRSITDFQQQHGFRQQWCRYLKIGITAERELLYAQIDRRVESMVALGLIDEVVGLLAAGYRCDLKSLSAIGYREVCAYLAGSAPLTETIELIKRNTRRYAKRQLTWFNADKDIIWLEYPSKFDTILKHAIEFFDYGET